MTLSSRQRLLCAAAVAILCQLLLVSTSAVESDEGFFAACAVRQMAAHAMPLTACIDTKPPGISLLYELGYRLFGAYNPAGLRILWLMFAAALALAIRALRRGSPAGDDAATVTLLLLTGSNYFLALKTELPAIALTTAGIALATRRRFWSLLSAGALIGVATLFKQPAAIFLAVAAVAARPPTIRDWRSWIGAGIALGAGWLVPLGMTAAAYWVSGQIDALIEQVWVRATLYATYKSAGYYAGSAVLQNGKFLTPMLCAVALLALASWQRAKGGGRPVDWTAWAYLSAGLVFVSLGGHFLPSYVVVLIPPLALLVTRAGLPDQIRQRGGLLAYGAFTAMLTSTALTMVTLHNASKFDAAIAARIDRAAAPGEELYVWGYAPELYPLMKRTAASGFVATNPLLGYFHSAAEASAAAKPRHVVSGDWDRFLRDLDGKRFLFVDASAIRMGDMTSFRPQRFDRMRQLLVASCTPLQPVGALQLHRCDTRHSSHGGGRATALSL